MTGYIDWPEPDQVYGADEAPGATRHCSICLTPTDGAPLCDRCARHLRRDCRLAHLAIAKGACVGSGTVRNLRQGEGLLTRYDLWQERPRATAMEQCMAVINYLNANMDRWYTWRQEWTWAEVGFFAAWLGFEEASNAQPE